MITHNKQSTQITKTRCKTGKYIWNGKNILNISPLSINQIDLYYER